MWSNKLGSGNPTGKDFVGKSDPYTEVLESVTVKPLSLDKIFHKSHFQSHFKYLI